MEKNVATAIIEKAQKEQKEANAKVTEIVREALVNVGKLFDHNLHNLHYYAGMENFYKILIENVEDRMNSNKEDITAEVYSLLMEEVSLAFRWVLNESHGSTATAESVRLQVKNRMRFLWQYLQQIYRESNRLTCYSKHIAFENIVKNIGI